MAGVRLLGTRPLKVSDCADYMGVCPQYIRDAIVDGVPIGGALIRLEAELIPGAQRHTYRIYEHAFLAFLSAIGWKHLPSHAAQAPGPALREVH